MATGFLLCGPDMPDINLQDERRHVVLNEMTATVGAVFLAMQFGCAQCHDHKYDPIRQHDFYRLRAFFESAEIFRDHPIPTPDELAARRAAEAADRRESEVCRSAASGATRWRAGRQRFREKNPDVSPPNSKQVLAELIARGARGTRGAGRATCTERRRCRSCRRARDASTARRASAATSICAAISASRGRS